MANFSLDDALAANVTQPDLQEWARAVGSPQAQWTDAQKMKLLSQSGNATGGLWQDQGGGQVSVPDQYLGSNMPDAGGFGGFNWGEMAGPLAMLLGPFAGMMSGLAPGIAGAGLEGGMGAGGAMDMGVGTQGWMDALNASAAGGTGGGLGQILQQLQGIPGGSQLVQGLMQQMTQQGGGAGAAGTTGAPGGGFNLGSLTPLLGIGSGLSSMFGQKPAVDPAMLNSLWQAGQNTYNTSLDPQGALYGGTAQRVQDQTRAGEAARGITMSPYGAGLENDAMRNFNIDWQNQQLGRQAQGTQAFAGAGNTAANAGIANNAQAFMQKQTGLNNLTGPGGLGGLFGGGTGTNPSGSTNQIGNWLNSLFGGGGAGSAGANTFNPSNSYDSSGTFTPYYTGTGAGGDPAYG